jgi:hypothetical protein
MEKSLQQHINNNKNELDNPDISSQRRRHLNDDLQSLERYQENHPNDDHDPTPLELYCDSYPEAPECKIYDI